MARMNLMSLDGSKVAMDVACGRVEVAGSQNMIDPFGIIVGLPLILKYVSILMCLFYPKIQLGFIIEILCWQHGYFLFFKKVHFNVPDPYLHSPPYQYD